jgi:hypothetical protein
MEDQAKQQKWWRKNKQLLINSGIVIVMVFALFALLIDIFGWDWTGFGGGESKITTTRITPGTSTVTPGTTVTIEQQPAKTFWDWLGLLGVLAIPVVAGIGAAWFTHAQQEHGQKTRRRTEESRNGISRSTC